MTRADNGDVEVKDGASWGWAMYYDDLVHAHFAPKRIIGGYLRVI